MDMIFCRKVVLARVHAVCTVFMKRVNVYVARPPLQIGGEQKSKLVRPFNCDTFVDKFYNYKERSLIFTIMFIAIIQSRQVIECTQHK